MICAGIDAGSRAIKALLLEAETKRILASGILDQGLEQSALSRKLFEDLLRQARLARSDVHRIIATGYARASVEADSTFTEITCHAIGVHHQAPHAATVIEIGGQDTKLLWLEERGAVRDFSMNDRCAAGTGRFLEMVAHRLEISLTELGSLAALSHQPSAISNVCAVFAETEIVGLLAAGALPQDIAAGVQRSVAARIVALARGRLSPPIFFTGGVALLPGMSPALSQALGQSVQIAANPQMTGALGAALLASRKA